ncbi:hypothetical protein ACHAXT_006444 [Thalassiosira profunda]
MQRRQAWKVAQAAVTSRLLLLLAMATSRAVLLEFHPGDDVLQFDLRLQPSEEGAPPCFCLPGHGCDDNWESGRMGADGEPRVCADSSTKMQDVKGAGRHAWLDRFYAFILPPITKWDAARFLTLSVDPWARYPPQSLPNNTITYDPIDDQTTCTGDATCHMPTDTDDDRRFHSSEQAHAFLPLLPLAIRYTANFLVMAAPSVILPPTYEATAALSAMLINILAFAIAAVSLYDLTTSMLKIDALEKGASSDDDGALQRQLAKTTALLFYINPAGVFFTASYSESIFAMLTFAGHAIFASNKAATRKSVSKVVTKCIATILFHGALALFVVYPVYYHDRRGYNFHCLDETNAPAWCDIERNGRNFSLYAHVQRKHWNVGLFRYYELKQIPNFLLALPALSLSFAAAAVWIRRSWIHHTTCELERKDVQEGWFGSVCLFPIHACLWSFDALSASSFVFVPRKSRKDGDKKQSGILLGQQFLSYYAILAGFALVGAFLAHVQISTRLICSSCPAFYWFCTALVFYDGDKRTGNERKSWFGLRPETVLYAYFALYNVLGAVMHCIWLPWT